MYIQSTESDDVYRLGGASQLIGDFLPFGAFSIGIHYPAKIYSYWKEITPLFHPLPPTTHDPCLFIINFGIHIMS